MTMRLSVAMQDYINIELDNHRNQLIRVSIAAALLLYCCCITTLFPPAIGIGTSIPYPCHVIPMC